VGLVEDLLNAYDEPFGDSSALPTYIVSRLTKGEVTVALTGDGGDELFAGYARFLGMMISGSLPGWAVATGNALARRLPHNPNFRSLPRRAQRFFAAAALPEDERLLRWIGFFPDRLASLLRPELADLLTREELTASFRDPLERNAHLSPLARTLALNFETYLLDDLLVKADRCSMAHGLELRSPFLDTALMEFAAGLPDRFRIRGRTFKYILKEAFRDLLPEQIRRRGKMGFGIPLPTWFRTHWRPLVEDRILGSDSALWQWIRPEPVQSLVREHLAGAADHGHQIWALLTLEGWLRRGRFSLPS
jgi:asparagine synthase (glutamine-hydrolysing)